MGEYIKNIATGEEIKIGVMDHCFFSRAEIKDWLFDPDWVGWYAGKEEAGTLESFYDNPGTLYDGIPGLIRKDFAILVPLGDLEVCDHRKVDVWKKGKRGSGYQYTVECEFKGKNELWAAVVGERYNEKGEGRTIFACDCCDTLLSLPQELINKALEQMSPDQREYLAPLLKGRS